MIALSPAMKISSNTDIDAGGQPTLAQLGLSSLSHAERRRLILDRHPEVRRLFGRDSLTFRVTLALLLAQTGIATILGRLGTAYWPLDIILALAFGAFANHANFVIIHDAIHNLVFPGRFLNRTTAILADLPNAIPTAMSFRCYHLKHHSQLSSYDHDADVPSDWEVRLVGNSSLRKTLWLFFFPLVQLARIPRLRGPLPIWSAWTLANWLAVIGYDSAMLAAFGPNALLYLLMSFWFSVGGLHPVSARWLQEHFAFEAGHTFDYYGPLNTVALNIGYHNEHHDFPEIPWTRLPDLKAAAPEFYEPLPSHSSWTQVMLAFITDPRWSLRNRRHPERA